MRPFTMRRAAGVAFLMLAVVTLPMALGASFGSVWAAAPRTASISPSTGLVDISGDGQFVSVSWTHFPGRQVVYGLECVRGATDPNSSCSQGGQFYSVCGHACPGWAYLGPSSKTGSGNSIVQVAIGLINTTPNLDPIPGKTFTCDFQHECSFFLTTDVSSLASAVEVPISFATPADACPTGGAFLSPSGGAAADRIFFGWAAQVCGAPRDISLSYVLKPSENALDDYVAGTAPFAVSPFPLSSAQNKHLIAKARTVSYAPVAASALVFAFRIKDQVTGSWVDHVVLTPELLARIFTGQITNWTDPAIQALNPGVAFPSRIYAVGRGDACEETLAMTRWIWAQAKQAWIDGGLRSGLSFNPFASGPTDILPSLSSQQPNLFTGARKVASVIATGDGDKNSTVDYGWVGYIDSSWAAQYDLATVTIQNGNGTTPDPSKQVSATFGSSGTVVAGLASMKPDSSGVLEADPTVTDPSIWPLPTVSYAVVPHQAPEGSGRGQLSPKLVGAMSGLLRYAVGDGQAGLPGGYVPLTAALTQQTTSLAGALGKKVPKVPAGGGGGGNPPPDYGSGGYGSGGGTGGGSGGPQVAPNTTIYVPPTPPVAALGPTPARLLFPGVLAVGLGSLIVGPSLLWGDKFRWRMRRNR